ncbi:MAG: DUF4398 domain-containing protein [Elusimicrobia bacterium]|nr:DUF4398 domain-containing protein [Elusimicrobiota bacterium]
MRKNSGILSMAAVGLIALATLPGCGKAKQDALGSLNAAKASMANARSVGAEKLAYATFMDAQSRLQKAESYFKDGDYSSAKKEAGKTSEIARRAQSDAESRKKSLGSKDKKIQKKTAAAKRR